MTLPPFPNPMTVESDRDLGVLLFGYFIMVQADDLGLPIDSITEEFEERVRQHILTIETTTAGHAAVEKALRKAAVGNFSAAGSFLREHMISGAVALKFIPIGINKSEQAAKFGREGAKGNKLKGASNRQAVLKAAKEILAGRTQKPSGNRLAKLIVTRTGMALGTVRTHLKKLRKEKKLD